MYRMDLVVNLYYSAFCREYKIWLFAFDCQHKASSQLQRGTVCLVGIHIPLRKEAVQQKPIIHLIGFWVLIYQYVFGSVHLHLSPINAHQPFEKNSLLVLCVTFSEFLRH